jgi:hypothetical protein
MKHFSIVSIILVLLLASSVLASEVNTLTAKARFETDKYIVPIELKNVQAMAAMDLPLKYSEGVTLEEVVFDGTRSADFDFKWATIDDSKNTVVIGLIPMMYGEKSDLEPGDGVIANLVFSIDDPNLEAIQISPTTMSDPDHSLMFIHVNEAGLLAESVPQLAGFEVALPVKEEIKSNLPTKYDLFQNAPNPFNPITRISYDLPKPSQVKLEVFNVLGQAVKTLVNDFREAGSQTVIWDGTDNSGSSVASGLYFYRISAGDYSATKKMMMLK